MPFQTGIISRRGLADPYILKTGARYGVHHWHVRNAYEGDDDARETESFEIANTKWRLKLSLNDNATKMILVSENGEDIDIWFKATVINQNRIQSDQSRGWTMRAKANRSVVLTLTNRTVLKDASEGFLHEESLLFAVEIQILCMNAVCYERRPIMTNRRVDIKLLTDGDIHAHVDGKIAFGLGVSAQSFAQSFWESTPLMSVEQAIKQDAEEPVRLWLCTQLQNGTLAMKFCLDAFPIDALSVGDLTDNDEDSDGHAVTLSFYLEPVDEGTRNVSVDSWILFVKCLFPSVEEMFYMGNIVLKKTTDFPDIVQAIANMETPQNIHLPTLLRRLPHKTVYLEFDQIFVRPLARYPSPIKAGMHSGSVLMVDAASFDRRHDLCNELTELFMRSLDVAEMCSENSEAESPEGTQPSSSTETENGIRGRSEEAEETCVICLDKPQTSGFLHENSTHKCVCKDCAIKWFREGRTCPVCMTPIEDVIFAFY